MSQQVELDNIKVYKIYSLASSENSELVRYVGYTGEKDPRNRLWGHTYESRRSKRKNLKRTHKINWINSVLEKGYKIIQEVLEDNIILEIEAKNKEIQYIKLFKSFGAYLVNETIGGGGGVRYGWKHSKETKDKISKAHKNKTVSSITKIKLSNSKKGTVSGNKNPHFGKPHSNKTKETLSQKIKGKYKVIYIDQFDLDGNFIKTWENYKEIINEYGGTSGLYSRVIRGERSHTKGYIWKLNNMLNNKEKNIWIMPSSR